MVIIMAVKIYPRIEIDRNKCTVPFLCKKCLQVCPQAVFDASPVKMTRMRETDPREPGAYRLTALYRDKCTACNQCVEVCPADALTITC